MRTTIFVTMAVLLAPMPGSAQDASSAVPPSVELHKDVERVLRDYESAWHARDARALAALFAADGYVLPAGGPPVHGRHAIQEYYEGRGGPLSLRAFAFAAGDSVGWVIGGYSVAPELPDGGKFVLTLRRGEDGRWLIVSDMDNRNR